ncbi:hypothetical protein EXU48_18840 [Occultella glacieicola]|uniref:Uncharacterized protein n=1 Tax=Occultella glacieicola TaxID=2518684 RepID=A0ABY2DZ76_9MICO|nr:hypothetical protein [Occultella glacieicola]TDE89985.1 hypothetical protein EXU48_18840 [Occultella glacieicola]
MNDDIQPVKARESSRASNPTFGSAWLKDEMSRGSGVPDEVSSKRLRRGLVVLAAILTMVLAVVWIVVVPREAICPAAGGPASCTQETRTAAGLRWSFVIVACYVVATSVLLIGRRSLRVLLPTTVAVFLLVCLFALGMVSSSTGFAIQRW